MENKKIAILSTDGFEYSELTKPQEFLIAQGHDVTVISPKAGLITAAADKGSVSVDKTIDEAQVEDYDALVLPGGLLNPDILRTIPQAIAFAKHFIEQEKPVAAICHGPWMLIEVDAVRGKQVTSWKSLKTDLENAGAIWVDEPVVTAGNIVTGRMPSDLDEFNSAFRTLLESRT